jgi:hypothetical protein
VLCGSGFATIAATDRKEEKCREGHRRWLTDIGPQKTSLGVATCMPLASAKAMSVVVIRRDKQLLLLLDKKK